MMEYTTIKIKEFDVIVSNCDLEKIAEHLWIASRKGKRTYFFYWTPYPNKKAIRLHRFIMGNPTGKVVDHINCNTLDNRRENLRICTSQENSRNVHKYKNNTSGYKGVTYDKSHTKKWLASITVNKKVLNLGRFNTPEEAHNAYCIASKKYHGEYGRVN